MHRLGYRLKWRSCFQNLIGQAPLGGKNMRVFSKHKDDKLANEILENIC